VMTAIDDAYKRLVQTNCS